MPLQSSTYTFQDLSGPTLNSDPADLNPYEGLIELCHNEPAQIQARYNTHRTARTTQQRQLLLSPDFPGISVDPILAGLVCDDAEKRKKQTHHVGISVVKKQYETLAHEEEEVVGFEDHRHNFSFWARPPRRVRDLVGEVQRRLTAVVPDLWLMPLDSLHMTTLEIFDSRDAAACKDMIAALGPLINTGTDFPNTLHQPPQLREQQDPVLSAIRHLNPSAGGLKRTRLVKPLLAYDAAAVALTWLPAAREDADAYTYHHLRRDMWELLSETSATNTAAVAAGKKPEGPVIVKSRYIVPSAHLTITRNINRWDLKSEDDERFRPGEEAQQEGVIDYAKVERYVKALDDVNEWLQKEYWDEETGMEWTIGEEKGLDCRSGPSWFGGGETVRLGKGF